MKELTGITTNTLTGKDGKKLHEIVVIVSEVHHNMDENKKLAQKRETEEYRFWAFNDDIDRIVEHLKKTKEQ